MPVRVLPGLPAVEALRRECITVAERGYGCCQADGDGLRIGILNLMPLKAQTETDLIRLLSNTPLTVDIDLIRVESHVSRHTPREHLERFYTTFGQIRHRCYDGFIVTGAPLETVAFEDVDYWPELCEILDWTRTNVRSTLYICWGAFAGLYHHYGVPMHLEAKKLSGVFTHRVAQPANPLFRGLDDEFCLPHSRFVRWHKTDIEAAGAGLTVAIDSPEAGVTMVTGRGGRDIYMVGHGEYSPLTLHDEYVRDLRKGMKPDVPANYYPGGDTTCAPVVRWRSAASLMASNWINYFVNKSTSLLPDDGITSS